VSDLVLCRRRVCFERLDPNPPKADEKRGYKHRALQELLGEDDFECEKEIIWSSYRTENYGIN
jgi:hypothetical protein